MIGFQFDAEDDLMKVMNLRVSETRTLRVTFGHLVDILVIGSAILQQNGDSHSQIWIIDDNWSQKWEVNQQTWASPGIGIAEVGCNGGCVHFEVP